jgi:hypothetical protein
MAGGTSLPAVPRFTFATMEMVISGTRRLTPDAVPSAPSLAASEVTASDERGGEDGGTISRWGPSPLYSSPE